MKRTFEVFLAAVAAGALLLPGGCSCGFDCSGSDNGNGGSNTAVLTLGFSDSLPEDLKKVVIKVDAITFRQSGATADDVKVDTFTISELGVSDDPDFEVDLLAYRGTTQLVVIRNLELEPALYDVFIDVVGDDVNNSHVVTSNDRQEQLNVPDDGRLVLEDLPLAAGTQAFTVEFGLAQSLQLDTEDDYLLTEHGVRLQDNAEDADLSGVIDPALFNAGACREKTEPETGNRVYLYQGDDLSSTALVDVYRPATSAEEPPAGSVAPFAVASVVFNDASDNWEYVFGFLPPGNYTLAFSCMTWDDDSVEWDDIDIPLPDTMKYRIELSEDESARCDLSADITVNPGDCNRSSL